LLQDGWLERLRVAVRDTGNAMPPQAVEELSDAMDLETLHLYLLEVSRRTRQIVMELSPRALKRKVEPFRLQRLMDEGAVIEAAHGLIDY
jgi:hypothetical protein